MASSETYNLEKIYDIICTASNLDTLGLLVGAGFTQYLTNNNAYSWSGLLERVCSINNINMDTIEKNYFSSPQIASKICCEFQSISSGENLSYIEAMKMFKEEVCKISNYNLDENISSQTSTYFRKLNINWIITTNYDTCLEKILTGKALSLGPNDSFVKIKNLIPIYHIHGIKTDPNNIVITNEDYVYQFRPNDYRQSRLPFLIKESTVLLLGYGLGDMNVVTAVDWSNNVFVNQNRYQENHIIQLLYVNNNPKEYAYKNNDGIIIVETNNLSDFFDELIHHLEDKFIQTKQVEDEINNLIIDLSSTNSSLYKNFIESSDSRKFIINKLIDLPYEYGYIYISFMYFLKNIFSELWFNASQPCCFEEYKLILNILLDLIIYFNLELLPQELLDFILYNFDRLSFFIGNKRGKSYEAYNTWENRKQEVNYNKITFLYNRTNVIAGYSGFKNLLEPLINQ